MRIAIISFHYAEYAISLANELSLKHDVILFLHSDNAKDELLNFEKSTKQKNPLVVLLPFIKSGNPLGIVNSIKTIKIILKFKPDVVHVQESLRDYEVLSVLFLLRFPIVLTIHDHIRHSGARENIIKRKIYSPLLRYVPDASIVHSNRILAETEILLPRLKGKIYSIPHGAFGDTSVQFSRNWQIGNLLFFGRIEKYKGIGFFVDAVKLLHKKGFPVKGVIAGRGKISKKHLEIINESGCFDLINNFIPANLVPILFKNANIVVLPYIDATQSGVMAMALGYGRPAVATDVGGLPEVVRNGYNGILVPPKNIYTLVKAIEKLINNQDMAVQMGYNAYHLSKNEFSWKEVAKETIKVYKKAIFYKLRDR